MRIVLILAAAVITVLAQAGDQTFSLEDGSELTLHEDQTWSCKGKGCESAFTEDFPLQLSDGRTIVVETDNQWHVMAKGELIGTKDIKVHSASAEAVGSNLRVDIATNQATKAVSPKVAAKIVAGAPKRKINNAKILACMQEQRVLPDIKSVRDPKSGTWTVTASLKVDRSQILALVRCAEQLEEVKSVE